MNLAAISFPVYRLKLERPKEIEGKLVYLTERVDLDTNEHRYSLKIVDDKAVEGTTLSRRRLRIPPKDLYRLSVAIFFLADLIKLAQKGRWFIDSLGHVFTYPKAKMAKVKLHAIESIHRLPGMGAVIEIDDGTRFKVLYNPGDTYKYAGVLMLDSGIRILYALHEQHIADYRRKV